MSNEHHEYTDEFIAGLEHIWGDGFLSPGGAAEVAAVVSDITLDGQRVLDIGCGVGGVDVLLALQHGASEVVGIDIEPQLLDKARIRAQTAGLSDRLSFKLVEPGPLPFASSRFDVVFSKDSIIHVPDKPALYSEVLRVLRPGGCFVGSDWLRGGSGQHSDAMRQWLAVVGLTFEMKNLAQTERALMNAGFVDVVMQDRNVWYQQVVREEVALASGSAQVELARKVGEEQARKRLESSSIKQIVVDQGELRPTHFVGYKAT